MRVSARWAEALPAVLLGIIAGGQLVLARTANLTPWKGGGFGMFSTLAPGAFRRVSVVADAPERSEPIEIPESLQETAGRAVNCPADWLLRRLAAEVAARGRRHGRPLGRGTLQVGKTGVGRGGA